MTTPPPVCGRNELCPCKSGKKYKKCCRDRRADGMVPEPERVIEIRGERANTVVVDELVPDTVKLDREELEEQRGKGPEATREQWVELMEKTVEGNEVVINYADIRGQGEPIISHKGDLPVPGEEYQEKDRLFPYQQEMVEKCDARYVAEKNRRFVEFYGGKPESPRPEMSREDREKLLDMVDEIGKTVVAHGDQSQ